MWVGVLLVVLLVLATTANVAIRQFSRVRLAAMLSKKGREDVLARLTERRHEISLATSLVRMASILALAFLIGRSWDIVPVADARWPYLKTFFVSLLLIMVFGVAIPHAWARYSGEAFLAASAPAFRVLRFFLFPLLNFLHLFDGLVRRLAGVPEMEDDEAEADQIEKEILDVVSEGEMSGAVHEQDASMIESVIHLRDKTVAEIMTPRIEIQALPDTATLYEAKEVISHHGHSRIPIYGKDIDDIKGVLYAKDLLNVDDSQMFDPTEIMRKVPFVPETKPVTDLLQELRQKKVQVAIVLDEYGGTAGLVTIEDIFEEIVGEIADEYETPEPSPIRRIDPKTLEIDARVHIDELNDELNIMLPDDEDYDTVGGFLFSAMGKIPAAGEEFLYNNIKFRVLDAEERKINRLRVEVLSEEAKT
jgi:putative hemolysin